MTEHTLALVQLEVDVFLAACLTSAYMTRSLSARNQLATVQTVVLQRKQVSEEPQVMHRLKTQSGHQQIFFHYYFHEVGRQNFIETYFQ